VSSALCGGVTPTIFDRQSRPSRETMTITTAILLALVSMFGFGAGFVLTQFGLRWMPPWVGVAISVPTSTLLFWCLAPFLLHPSGAELKAVALFACVGLVFPGAAALLNFESNRLMGPHIAGGLSSLTPVFAVMLAIVILGERVRVPQLLALAALVIGISLMYRVHVTLSARSLWLMALPVGSSAIRGVIQPVAKLGLAWWPNPIAAVVVSYTVSSVVLIVATVIRSGGTVPTIAYRGALWFAAVGLCNGLAVLSMYGALASGPVTIVSPLIAGYPLVTLLLSRALLAKEEMGPQLIAGVVSGVVLLLIA
jgi:drug/metabolite transporter (DMT)-like permease